MSFSTQISPKPNRPAACRAARLALALVLSIGSVSTGLITTPRAEVIDLRDGARTIFFGDQVPGGAGDFYGWAICFGDIDGDGRLDYMSSSANSEGPNDLHPPERDVYVFFGRPRSEIDSLYDVDAPGVADIVIYRGGFAMACGDIDADGYDDMILAENEGYVIFGGPRETLRSVYNLKVDSPDYTPPDVAIIGSTRLGGYFFAGLGLSDLAVSQSLVSGDINDDGYADIAIGDYMADGPSGGRLVGGATYVIFGRERQAWPGVIDVDFTSGLAHPDVVIYAEPRDNYSMTLAIGDLDGDGIDDLLTSTTDSWGRENITPLSGEILGYWGKPDWKPLYDLENEEFDFSLYGDANGFGYRMVTGDLDGDGRDELIVGQPFRFFPLPDDRRWMGEYRVYFGRPRSMWPRSGNALQMADVLIVGASGGDVFSNDNNAWTFALSMATGDHDGDGYEDLLIGAGYADGPAESRFSAGEAYLLRGRARGDWPAFVDLKDTFDMIIYGVDTAPTPGRQFDLLGHVTAMGDFDGNGLDEIFVAAPFADGPNNFRSDPGEVYVIFDKGPVTEVTVTPGPRRVALLANYPNPFNPTTTFRFRAPEGVPVSLTVYDALGHEVSRPLIGKTMVGEEAEIRWDARDRTGRQLPSGVYFVKLQAGREVHSRKVLLVR